MDNIIEEPKIGEVVSVNFDKLCYITVRKNGFSYDENNFQYLYDFDYISNLDNYGLGSKPTLLKYIGEGKFVELYTKRIIYFLNSNFSSLMTDFQKQYSFMHEYNNNPNYIEFMQIYKNFKKNPIFIMSWNDIDPKKKQEIGLQSSYKDFLTFDLIKIYEQATKKLENGFKELIEEDINYAYGENEIINFTKQYCKK